MTDNSKRQVEVQGTKKLDSVKGVQALSFEEVKKINGGIFNAVAGGLILYLVVSAIEYPEDFLRGLKGK